MERDFTYIDDIVEGVFRLLDKVPVGNKEWDESKDDLSTSFAPYKIYNIGNNNPVPLMRFINVLEEKLGKKAEKIFMDMQPGDVLRTYADVSDLEKDINFKPKTSIEEGLDKFVKWYKEYYNVEDPAHLQGFRRIVIGEPSHPYMSNWWPVGHIIGYGDTFVNEYVDYLTAIKENKQVTPNFEDGLRCQRVLDAAEQSAHIRQWVKVQY